jgi:integrase/recombinase XerD
MRPGRKVPIPPLPETEWPVADRQAWAVARASADPLDDPGLAAHWAASSVRHGQISYGYWLAWLTDQGLLDKAAGIADRLDRDWVREYIAFLRLSLAPGTVAILIRRLLSVVQAMVPGAELSWLRAGATRLQAGATPTRDKASRLVGSECLFDAGLELMEQAADEPTAKTQALRYRDGLMIAFLALRPARLSNLAVIQLGQHLIDDGEIVHVQFAAAEMKNGRPLDIPWPPVLLEALRTYLAVHRPVLLAGRSVRELWVGRQGRLGYQGCRQAILRATETMGGITPHLFRDNAATTIALHDPEHVGIIPALLGHTTPRTAEKHYNHATSILAARAHQQTIARLRRDGRGRRRRRHRNIDERTR